MPCFDGQLCLSDRQASPSGAVDAEQPLGREILGRPLTAEGAAWCVYGLSLALAVVGAVLWFLNRDLGGAVFVPPLLLVRALPRSGVVVAVRRRGHRIGWLFLGMGLAAAAQHRWPCVAAVGLPHRNQHLARQSRSERTVATDLIGVRQADALLRANGTILQAATRPIRCGAGSGRSCRTSRSSACPGVHRVWVTLDTSPAQRKVSLNGLCSPPEPQIPEERPLAVPGNAG